MLRNNGGCLSFISCILPVYNILLLAFGFVFGQFGFFWKYEKKTLKRIGKWLGFVE